MEQDKSHCMAFLEDTGFSDTKYLDFFLNKDGIDNIFLIKYSHSLSWQDSDGKMDKAGASSWLA